MKKYRMLVIGLVLLCLVLFVLYVIETQNNSNDQIHFVQKANGSNGEFWKYELSTDAILTEKEYYKSKVGRRQNWIFEQIGVGEVTITWKAHEGGMYDEKNSYCITYYFYSDGTYTVLEDTREIE